MKRKALYVLLIFFISKIHAQTISEKELFVLKYKGPADAYSFMYDSSSGKYCYLYRVEDDNKTFIISNNSVSEKFDNVYGEYIKFDLNGNYYSITENYKADYGIDNTFLVVNGKNVLNHNYIEGYSSYINNKGEFVFIFKEFDLYKLGYYSIDKGLRQSGSYDMIRPIYSYNAGQIEDEQQRYREEDFYLNEKGERGFIVIAKGKAKIIFETSEIETPYSDINESSLTKNNNNELSYIAKNGGRFYEKIGNEFAVSGSKAFNNFEMVMAPLYFNNSNEPVYAAGDSITENNYSYFLTIGNQKQDVYLDVNKSNPARRI